MKLRIVCMRAGSRRNGFRPRLACLSAAAALAITAATVLAPGGPAALASSLPDPAITVADGNSVIAVQTSEDGLRFYWNQYGTNNWHGEQVAANGTTFSQPAIAQVGNTVVIAVEGVYNSLDLYWQTNGASGWNAETVATIRTTYSAPSLAQNGNTTIIAAEGPSNSLDFYWAINGTATWHPEVVAGADSIASAPAISAHDNGVNIVARTYGGLQATFWWAFNGSPTWTPSVVPGGDLNDPSIVAYPGNPGGVHVVARGLLGDSPGVSTNVNGSGTWTWTALYNNSPTAPIAVGDPAITMNNGSENIAFEDVNGNLDFYWQDSSGAFHGETVDTANNL